MPDCIQIQSQPILCRVHHNDTDTNDVDKEYHKKQQWYRSKCKQPRLIGSEANTKKNSPTQNQTYSNPT